MWPLWLWVQVPPVTPLHEYSCIELPILDRKEYSDTSWFESAAIRWDDHCLALISGYSYRNATLFRVVSQNGALIQAVQPVIGKALLSRQA
jgi:hypothetical protein